MMCYRGALECFKKMRLDGYSIGEDESWIYIYTVIRAQHLSAIAYDQ